MKLHSVRRTRGGLQNSHATKHRKEETIAQHDVRLVVFMCIKRMIETTQQLLKILCFCINRRFGNSLHRWFYIICRVRAVLTKMLLETGSKRSGTDCILTFPIPILHQKNKTLLLIKLKFAKSKTILISTKKETTTFNQKQNDFIQKCFQQ